MFRFVSVCTLLLLTCQMAFSQSFASQTSFKSFDDIKTQSGHILLRIEMKSTGAEPVLNYQLSVTNGSIDRMAAWFFEDGEDALNSANASWTCKASNRYFHSMPMNLMDLDVVTAWLHDVDEKSSFTLIVNGQTLQFTAGQLFRDQEFKTEVGSVQIIADLLADKEIGELDPASVGIADTGNDFDFTILADTHAGDGFDVVNAYISKIVGHINDDEQPAFVIDIGDVVTAQGEAEHFQEFIDLFHPLESPLLLLVGNHECRYKSDFYPGYNMDPFADFFATQKQVNGMQDILYSFNLGEWHFVAFPDPHRRYFFQKHPHYFDWLRRDLEKHKDRPTVVFQHVHSLPLGINPMTNYVNSPQILQHFFDCLTAYGNVKYVISGHTHIPLRAAFKTAMQYQGIKFLNLPASSNFPRNFGEPDFDGESSRGYTVAQVRGDRIDLAYQMIDGGRYDFPDSLPEFDPQAWPLWLNEPWQLPATETIVNGSFEQGLDGWRQQYVYLEDENPSNIRVTTDQQAADGDQSLYLYTRKRGYDVEGDNRMTQTLNTLCQAVRAPHNGTPVLDASFMPDGDNWSPGADAGNYILVDGYSGSSKKLALVYWIGRGYFKPRGLWSSLDDYIHFDLTTSADQWHNTTLNIAQDYNAHHETTYTELGIDRLVVQMGTWNLNQRTGNAEQEKAMRTGIYWDSVELTFPASAPASSLDGAPVNIKPEDEIESRWLMGGMGNERSH